MFLTAGLALLAYVSFIVLELTLLGWVFVFLALVSLLIYAFGHGIRR